MGTAWEGAWPFYSSRGALPILHSRSPDGREISICKNNRCSKKRGYQRIERIEIEERVFGAATEKEGQAIGLRLTRFGNATSYSKYEIENFKSRQSARCTKEDNLALNGF